VCLFPFLCSNSHSCVSNPISHRVGFRPFIDVLHLSTHAYSPSSLASHSTASAPLSRAYSAPDTEVLPARKLLPQRPDSIANTSIYSLHNGGDHELLISRSPHAHSRTRTPHPNPNPNPNPSSNSNPSPNPDPNPNPNLDPDLPDPDPRVAAHSGYVHELDRGR
jgi:hypothetical protein